MSAVLVPIHWQVLSVSKQACVEVFCRITTHVKMEIIIQPVEVL